MEQKELNSTSCLKERWKSQLGFIWATTGAAVGLGNIWKFPYMVGSNGGSAFFLIYILAVAIVGIPVLSSELVIGRLGHNNPIMSFELLSRRFGASKNWSKVGWLGMCTLFLVLSFYSVVGGWSIYYFFLAISDHLNATDATASQHIWQRFLDSPYLLIANHTTFILMTAGVVALGLRKGIERTSNIIMPALLVLLLILAIYGCMQPGFSKAVDFLLGFRHLSITHSVVIAALGHAAFTLAVGAGCMSMYGAYLPDKQPLGLSITWIVALDLLVALLAGIATFSIVMSYNIHVTDGPGLMFEALPIAFANMSFGIVLASAFFVLLILAAWSSAISLMEPLVAMLVYRYRQNRHYAALTVGLGSWVLGIIAILSFNIWKKLIIFDKWVIFTAMTDLATNVMLPLGALGFALFAGHIMPHRDFAQAMQLKNKLALKIIIMTTKWITPLAILTILFSQVVL